MKPYVHKVQYYETDRMGITHHSNYVRFMEEARIDFFERVGLPYEKMEAQGLISPVVGVDLQYKKTTTYPDLIEIQVRVSDISALKFSVEYKMICNGAVCCIAHSSHCFIKDGRPVVLSRDYPELYQALVDAQ